MSMLTLDNSWEGTGTLAGVITFKQTGLPGDLATRLPGSERIYTARLQNKTFAVSIVSGPAEVIIEANEGDPIVAGDWYAIATVTASGATTDNNIRKFVRARIVTPGGGITVHLTASG